MYVVLTIFIRALLIAGVAYAQVERARKFKEDYEACAQRLNVPNELRIDLAICASVADGELLFSNGAYNPQSALRIIESYISDPVKLQQAYEIFQRCDAEAVYSGSLGLGRTIRFLICGLPLLSLFDNE